MHCLLVLTESKSLVQSMILLRNKESVTCRCTSNQGKTQVYIAAPVSHKLIFDMVMKVSKQRHGCKLYRGDFTIKLKRRRKIYNCVIHGRLHNDKAALVVSPDKLDEENKNIAS